MRHIDPNKATIAAYNQSIAAYLQTTPQSYQPYHDSLLRLIDNSLSRIPRNGKVFEIGSATPREARYIRGRGYTVQCSDATKGFVDYLRSQGEKALFFNALTNSLPAGYDMVLAIAVAPHFTRDELTWLLHKMHDSLQPNNIFAFNVKQGFGEEWVTEKIGKKRYICYWQPEEIRELVKQAGFEVIFSEVGQPGDLPSHHWITIAAQRI